MHKASLYCSSVALVSRLVKPSHRVRWRFRQTASVRRRYPQIPWKKIVGMRNVVIHGYFGVDTEVIWRTIQDDLPPLRRIVNRILIEGE
jgi:hypothetical protein